MTTHSEKKKKNDAVREIAAGGEEKMLTWNQITLHDMCFKIMLMRSLSRHAFHTARDRK